MASNLEATPTTVRIRPAMYQPRPAPRFRRPAHPSAIRNVLYYLHAGVPGRGAYPDAAISPPAGPPGRVHPTGGHRSARQRPVRRTAPTMRRRPRPRHRNRCTGHRGRPPRRPGNRGGRVLARGVHDLVERLAGGGAGPHQTRKPLRPRPRPVVRPHPHQPAVRTGAVRQTAATGHRPGLGRGSGRTVPAGPDLPGSSLPLASGRRSAHRALRAVRFRPDSQSTCAEPASRPTSPTANGSRSVPCCTPARTGCGRAACCPLPMTRKSWWSSVPNSPSDPPRNVKVQRRASCSWSALVEDGSTVFSHSCRCPAHLSSQPPPSLVRHQPPGHARRRSHAPPTAASRRVAGPCDLATFASSRPSSTPRARSRASFGPPG